MSIKLKVAEYCQDCRRFEAHVEKDADMLYYDGCFDTVITCENAEACNHVARGFKELIESIKHKED